MFKIFGQITCIIYRHTIKRIGTPEHPVTPPVDVMTTAPRRTKLTWQVYTQHHCARVRQLQDQETYNFLGEAKRWMTFPEDRAIVINFSFCIV